MLLGLRRELLVLQERLDAELARDQAAALQAHVQQMLQLLSGEDLELLATEADEADAPVEGGS